MGRSYSKLNFNAQDLIARGAIVDFELADFIKNTSPEIDLGQWIKKYGYPDEVLIAYGTIGDHLKALNNSDEARIILETNFTSVALWCLAITQCCLRDGPLSLVVISSVAGDRGRGSNFIYGSAKGGLNKFLEGLQHSKNKTLLNVLCVKPGFVKTPMNHSRDTDGFLWAAPDRVAFDILNAVRRQKKIIYTPWFWSIIMLIIKSLPRKIFNKLNL